jgi:hypothetical protein
MQVPHLIIARLAVVNGQPRHRWSFELRRAAGPSLPSVKHVLALDHVAPPEVAAPWWSDIKVGQTNLADSAHRSIFLVQC